VTVRENEEQLLDTVGLIYDAAIGMAGWDDVLTGISDVCGVANTAFVINDRDLQIAEVRTPRADPAVIAAYENHWWRYDPTIAATANAKVGEVTSLETTGRELFLASEFHGDFWSRSGLGAERLASNLLLSEYAFGSLVAQNGPRQNEISTHTLRTFRLILPHMIRAVGILRKLQGQSVGRIARQQAIAAGADSAIVVDAAARPIMRDAGLDRALATHACLRLDSGHLVIDDVHCAIRFGQLMEGCAKSGLTARGGSISVPDADGHPATSITVIPWSADVSPEGQGLLARPAALILLEDLRSRQDSVQGRFRQRYGLTPAEARLAFELLGGGGRAEVAARLDISVATVRTHLSRIFDKTGTRRQSELVALILDAD
jgi:DNA-binding CsgD family transcriptional regulator